ncbi:sugar-binding protein [Pseudomonas cichorii]|nr:RHS repeat-associated core domain-containing protein [Pseudomonas cichorii]GFM49193.1 sugar-binding protein [Pseudomonas cichorii]
MPIPTVHSNAFNFLSAVQAGVDPRTGQYTCSIALPELKANHLCGPSLPLTLSFSPMSPRDIGFGKGWSLRLSHFDTVSRILSLSTGETFRIEGSISQPSVPERKIDSFHFSFEGSNRYRVVHKSGLVEILTLQGGDTLAWVTEVHSAEGHRLSLAYDTFAGETVLRRLSDDYGTLLDISRLGSAQINVDLHPGQGSEGGPLARFTLVLDNGEVSRVILPSDNQAGWHFTYEWLNEYLCIKELRTPLGGHEYITYDAQGHEFPQSRYPSLPRVQQHAQHPGFGQPPLEVHYRYSSENFLGFNASGLIWDDDGLDNLYQADPRYTYNSTEMLWVEGQALRSTLRVFNNFHLLTEETVTQRDNVLSTRTTYHGTPGLPFIQQPPQCQLPREVLKLWYHPSASSQTHEEITRTTFDVFGNLLTQENPDGTLETRRYYPAAGGDGCPADPQGFVRNLQDSTVTPAPGAPGEAPVLRTAHRYALQTGVGGATPGWLTISDERLLQVNGSDETELQHTAFRYIDQPADRYLHGRKLQETLTLNGLSTITDYTYQRTRNARAGETVQQTEITLSTDFDNVRKTHTLQHSLLNGQPLLNREDNDLEIAYRYDALGRVIEEIAAPDTPYEASRQYRYVLSAVDGQQAEQEETNAKGGKTRTLLDGANRVIEVLRQGADENNPTDYFQIYRAAYDRRGLLVQDIETDWLSIDSGLRLRELALTRTYQYDDWGEQCLATGPDGVSLMTESDPVRQIVRRWVQSNDTPPLIASLSETRANRFGKPEWNRALDASGNVLNQTDYVYDGLGRCIQELDAFGHSTSLRYDAWSRLIDTTLPDLTVVEREYAPHSHETLPTSLRVKAAQASEAILLGEQRFDGLDRAIQIKVGPRITRLNYKGAQTQVDECITPGNQAIQFQYTPGLSDQPVRTITADEQADFTYDFKTSVLTTSQNARSRTEFEYNRNGQLTLERRVEDGVSRETHHVSSFGGRALSRQEPGGLTSAYEYDAQGRLESISQGVLKASFIWSGLGQLQSTLTTDASSGNRLETRLQYNDQGQETERTLELTGHDTRTLTQAWRKDGRLIARHLKTPTRSLLDETFDYDERGRLTLHACRGETLPHDRYGHGMSEQRFDFDALDNITCVNSTFSDGSTDQALFGFAPDDPTQLVSITHTHPDYPASITLDYDDNGNLLHDENAQQLMYDTQSRLLGVTATDGSETAHYRYDSHNHLVGVRHGGEAETLRFYQDERLSTRIQGSETTSYLYGGNQPLGQQSPDDDKQTLLFMTDAKQSLIGESHQAELRTAVYNAYGERSSEDGLNSLLGFNGEVRDEASGWYLLGRGYRAYNPTLMRFHSPDSLSPFGAGGLNPYVYCLGDPIGLTDPTGHISHSLFMGLNIAGMVLGIIGTVATGGLAAPALTLQFGLNAIAQTAGVAAVVTGGVGTFTPDRQAKKVLGITSAVLGVVSLVFGLASVAAGTSRWFPKAAGSGLDDLSEAIPLNPSVNSAQPARAAPQIITDHTFDKRLYRHVEDISPDNIPATTTVSSRIPPTPPPKPSKVNFIPPQPSPPPSPSVPLRTSTNEAAMPLTSPTKIKIVPQSTPDVSRLNAKQDNFEFLEMIEKAGGKTTNNAKTLIPAEGVVAHIKPSVKEAAAKIKTSK